MNESYLTSTKSLISVIEFVITHWDSYLVHQSDLTVRDIFPVSNNKVFNILYKQYYKAE